MAQKPATAKPPVFTNLFESKIRPLLLGSCVGCHGKDSPGGGLRLDVAVSPEKALTVIARVKGEGGKPKMPLGSTLTKEKIEALESWVRAGAVWPAGAAPRTEDVLSKGKNHWAFKPISHPAIPKPKFSAWIRSPIDAFILTGLERKGLKPNPTATPRELIRRLSYDLTGLPPTPEEVAVFEADKSPRAYETVVDRLLASPHYGEKWGRHWLDLVRYAETNSYERDNPKPNVYKYRDYVIKAFNDDKPYNQFVREQIAGDEMPGGNADSLIATGYYRLGIWDDEPADMKQAQFDDLDDLVVTTGQAFLGLTLDCARCHDHKFDPIPQKDYYRMAAFFNNVNRFKNGGPTDEATVFLNPQDKIDFDKKVAEQEAKKQTDGALLKEISDTYKQKRDTLLNPADISELKYRYFEGTYNTIPDFDKLTPRAAGTLIPGYIDLKPKKREDNFGFVFEGQLNVPKSGAYTLYLDSDDGSRLIIDGKVVLEKSNGGGQGMEKHTDLQLTAGRVAFRIDYFQQSGPFGLNFSWSGKEMLRRPLSVLANCSELGMPTLLKAELVQIVGKQKSDLYNKVNAEKIELDKMEVTGQKALCVTEAGVKAPDMYVMKRGNPNLPDAKVEAGFPVCVGGGDAQTPTLPSNSKTTGRRTQLADWLVSPTNVLTPRVIANRIWQGHFGRGIVRTPNDFGLQGSKPTQPELLDWLATEFVKNGWSFKKMHRLILTSNAYKQSSHSNVAGMAKDPNNDNFWRVDMRRLDAEEVRDSVLAVSGSLNPALYGESIYPEIPKDILAAQSRPGNDWYTDRMKPADLNRRSIYIHVKRSMIYPLLANFDLPDTDRTTPFRFTSTQPTQALSMINGSFVNQKAKAMAAQIRADKRYGTDTAFIKRAFALVQQRTASELEVREGISLINKLKTHGASEETAQEYLCLLALNLDEFMYVD